MKAIVITGLIISLFPAFAAAETLTVRDKQDFVDHYRSWRKLLEEFPDKPAVKVLFVDIDNDGVSEAVATSYGERYEDGNIWTIFQRNGNSWSPLKLRMKDATTVDPRSSLFSRDDEFHLLIGGNNLPQLAVIHKNYDRLLEGGKAAPTCSKVIIEKTGFMTTEKLPDLNEIVAYSSDFKMLQRLHVESFTH